LILEDLKYNGESKLSEIKSRLSKVSESDIQKSMYKLVKNEDIKPLGAKETRHTRFQK